MKARKILSLVLVLALALALALTLAGCGKEENTPPPGPSPEAAAEPATTPSLAAVPTPSPTEEATPTPEPSPSPTSTPLPSPTEKETPCYAKVGTYNQDSEYGGTNEIYIESISPDQSSLTFFGNWDRSFGIGDETPERAALNGNVATFDTGVHKGKIEFKADCLLFTFLESPMADHVGEPSRFDYKTQEELIQEYIDWQSGMLLGNGMESEWFHSPARDPGEYIPVTLLFSEDGTVTCTTRRFIGNPEGVIWDEDWEVTEYQLPYQTGYKRITVDGNEYEMFVDMGATWHLYLTALGDDPFGLDGEYQLGDLNFI